MTEARFWQLTGTVGVFAAAIVLRVAMADFDTVANSPQATYGDGLWSYARGVLSGFLFIIAAATLIAGHVLRVIEGIRHRSMLWLPAAGAVGVIGVSLVIWNGGNVAAQISASQMDVLWMTNGFPHVVAGCSLSLLAALLLLGDRTASHVASAKLRT